MLSHVKVLLGLIFPSPHTIYIKMEHAYCYLHKSLYFGVGSNFYTQQMGKRLMEIARKEGIQAQEVCSICSQSSVIPIIDQNFKNT
jgi:hypothetical protein